MKGATWGWRMIKGLWRAKQIEFFEGRPFQKVRVLDHSHGAVRFSTEYPVRVLSVREDDFLARFEKWRRG